MKTTHITAIFNPQTGKQLSSRETDCKGQRFKFKEYSKGHYYPNDKNFPHSLLCSEHDLKEIEENETKTK